MNISESEKLIVEYNKLIKGVTEQEKRHIYLTITNQTLVLDGLAMTEFQIAQLIEYDRATPNRSFSEQLLTFDFYNTLQYVLNVSTLELPVTPEFIKQIASMVMKNTGKNVYSNWGNINTANGDYRKTPARIISNICPDQQLISRMMISMCEETNREIVRAVSLEDQLKAAFNLHYKLLRIQPFGEGNFRVAILMMNYVLSMFNVPMSTVFKTDEARYNLLLDQLLKLDKVVPFQRFMNVQLCRLLREEIKWIQKKDAGSVA